MLTYSVELKRGDCPRCGRAARFKRTTAVADRGATRAERLFAGLYNLLAGHWRWFDSWCLGGCDCVPRWRRKPRRPPAEPEQAPVVWREPNWDELVEHI